MGGFIIKKIWHHSEVSETSHFLFLTILQSTTIYITIIGMCNLKKYTNTSNMLVDTWAKNLYLTWTDAHRPAVTPGTSSRVQAPQRGSPSPWGQILVEVHWSCLDFYLSHNHKQPKIILKVIRKTLITSCSYVCAYLQISVT